MRVGLSLIAQRQVPGLTFPLLKDQPCHSPQGCCHTHTHTHTHHRHIQIHPRLMHAVQQCLLCPHINHKSGHGSDDFPFILALNLT